MHVTLSGILILFSFLQFRKQALPKLVKPSEKLIVSSDSQNSNAPLPIDVTVAGNIKHLMLVHPANT